MIQCKQCGANLPEEARFCLQCGAQVEPRQSVSTTPQPGLDFVQPALAGGVFLGVLSTLPIISAGNCLCFMWILGGGGIAAVLLTKQRPAGITYGDGALVGVLSGVFGAIVGTVVSIPVRIVMARIFGSQAEALEQAMRELGVEGPMHDLMLRLASPEITITTVLFTFMMNLLLYSLFAMIGGILAVAILNKKRGAGVNPRPDVPM